MMKVLEQDIPRIGMGCWAIGGEFFSGDTSLGFSNVDDHTSTRTVHAAYEAGVRLFDTAAVYGAGHSERLLGAALKGRNDAIIVSKFGTSFDENSKQVLGPDIDSESILAQIDDSLLRLGRDHVDIMLLHLNSVSIDKAALVFEAMSRARDMGKVRGFGWSTDFPASVKAMAETEGFIAIEHASSVLVDVPSIRSVIQQYDLIALNRSPLAMGILTGKFKADTTLPADDVRAVESDRRDYFEQGKVADKYMTDLHAVRELLQTGGRTLTQGALCWLLARSDRNLPIPGARTPEQILENFGATEHGALPDSVMDEIEQIISREPEGPPRAR